MFQGHTAGKGADRKRTHVPRLYVALGGIPMPLPQRCLSRGHHARRRDTVHQKARQVPEDPEEGGKRGEK